MTIDMTGVGLIGYGKAGRVFHAPLIRSVDGLHLHKIVEHRGDDAVNALLAEPEVALVVVATPNDSHFDLGRRALLAGKHVVIDKPFTVTSEAARQLIALARERNRTLTVFHNRRWEGDFLTIRRLLHQNALGRVVFYEARFDRFRNEPRPGAWRETSSPGSGILYDLGSHLIDQALVLFGKPDSITADVRTERDFGEADDAFDIWMHYPRLKVSLTAGMLVRERTPRFTVRGTEGTFVKFGVDPQEAALTEGRTPRDSDWGREPRDQWGTLITDRGEETVETLPGSYQKFYENVRDVIAGRAELAVDPQQACNTIELIEQAAASSRPNP
jgi:scyllo-inositol 2-dehydrogenase (NADP+)